MKITVLLLFLFVSVRGMDANPAYTGDENKDGIPDQWIEIIEKSLTRMKIDRNYDGQVDYTVDLDALGVRLYEEYDFNYDGTMDDFYYYERGQLIRQEVDTNFDGRIDVWVYLHEGLYIKSYERDSDYDGEIDLVKEYGSG
jgi:hypothetical protein